MRAAAVAASQPAWPPPITMTSNVSMGFTGQLLARPNVSEKAIISAYANAAVRLFHVKHMK
jgi:hypothetical protein